MQNIIEKILSNIGINSVVSFLLSWAVILAVIFLVAYLTNIISKKIILKIIKKISVQSKNKWDDILIKNHFFDKLSHIGPALILFFLANLFFDDKDLVEMLRRFSLAYMYFIGILSINSFLTSINYIYQSYEVSKNKPIKSYIQVLKIIIFVIGAILILANLINKSPWGLLSGLGAMTAILLLVFKDSILGFVSSIQLSSNDMIRIGDWIEVPKYDADGDVIEVSLTTIKIQNFDKTITTIPTHALTANSFKNWRGMQDSSVRRIKRSFNIDLSSIQFCSKAMLDKFERIEILRDFLKNRREEITIHNKEKKINDKIQANGRRLTNIGVFRYYLQFYLKQNPNISNHFTFLVRQLATTESGLPIEIYIFSNDNDWLNYEEIQADVFDHIYAVIPEFNLRLFQNPTGNDFSILAKAKK